MKKSTKYTYAHRWIYKRFGKAIKCELNKKHKAKRFEWSNISRKYKHDIKDWQQLCPSCHRKFDYKKEYRAERVRPVIQYDINWNKIKSYQAIFDAERETHILHSSIANMLSGRTKTAGGYKWKYKIK